MLLRQDGGTMNYMKLIKLLYIIDREALSLWERPITGDTYVSMKHGPVLSNVLELINYGENVSSYWFKYIGEPVGYSVKLLECDPGQDLLNKKEIELILKTWDDFKELSPWDMVDFCHGVLPEWKDPGEGAIPIRIDEILKVRGRSDDEIKEIEEEVNNLAYLKEILAIED